MRERNLRVLLLIYLVPLVYLFEANILATVIGIKLPFAIIGETSLSFGVEIAILCLQLVGLLAVSFVIKRQRRTRSNLASRTASE